MKADIRFDPAPKEHQLWGSYMCGNMCLMWNFTWDVI